MNNTNTLKDEIVKIVEASTKKSDLHIENVNYYSTVDKPRDPKNGDFASNIAMMLASRLKKNPLEIAETVKSNISSPMFSSIDVAKPGFINFSISMEYLRNTVKKIQDLKEKYGLCNIGQGEKVNLEFVSANPTGPLHIGHGRWAALGDSIARIMTAAGYNVHREFYVNDVGNQIYNLGNSVKIRYIQLLKEKNENFKDQYNELLESFENDGKDGVTRFYHGNDLKDLAQTLYEIEGTKFLDKEIKDFSTFALERILTEQKELLHDVGLDFDLWFRESSLHEPNEVDKTIEFLKQNDKVVFKDNAVWLTGSGDDKENVLIKSDGAKTYFASDITYHKNKYDRGFDRLINIWGADHHGHVKRMKNAVGYLGRNPDSLEIIIGQLVNLYRNGEAIRMSKRTGEMVSLREVADEVGKDALRYLMLMKQANNTIDFDIDLAKQQSKDNPVFYVQYAHARICSILRMAESKMNLTLPDIQGANLELLAHGDERQLMFRLASYPDEIKAAAIERAPHRLTFYAAALATDFHQFYTNCRVLNTEDVELTKARLTLAMAVRIVLRNLLEDIFGVSAPESM